MKQFHALPPTHTQSLSHLPSLQAAFLLEHPNEHPQSPAPHRGGTQSSDDGVVVIDDDEDEERQMRMAIEASLCANQQPSASQAPPVIAVQPAPPPVPVVGVSCVNNYSRSFSLSLSLTINQCANVVIPACPDEPPASEPCLLFKFRCSPVVEGLHNVTRRFSKAGTLQDVFDFVASRLHSTAFRIISTTQHTKQLSPATLKLESQLESHTLLSVESTTP